VTRTFPRRATLSDHDRVVVRALAEAMFEDDDRETYEAGRLDQLVDDVDAFISVATKTTRFGLRVALFLVRLAPIFFFLRLTTIERLPRSERTDLLARLERSKRAGLSLAFVGWRTVMTLVYYDNERELHQIGYAGAERTRWKRALPVVAPTPVVVPVPLESGVRLREDLDDEVALPDSQTNKVA